MGHNINSENYFCYAEAIHCFASLNCGGQASELYSILSRSEFKPGPLWSETICEKENAVYTEINEENCADLFEELTAFLKGTLK